jgi:hypothetical protein
MIMKMMNMVAAAAVALASLSAGAVLAQSPGAAPSRTAVAGPDSSGAPSAGGPPGGSEVRAPVLKITSVEIIRTPHAPAMDIVRVRGLASSPGWEEAELVPLTRTIPEDGILQLIFVARAPAEAAEASALEPIEAIFPLEIDHGFKGVNVHGAVESVEVTTIPGYVESKTPLADCGKCVGKVLVRKGTTASGARSAADIVREEQLAPNARVIRPGDGMAAADSDPNRLTLIVNKDGRITSAVWE